MSKKREVVNEAPKERFITLTSIETELVKTAVSENAQSKAVADGALAQRLLPIRTEYEVGEGTRVDFRPSKDGKKIVMVVFEAPKAE